MCVRAAAAEWMDGGRRNQKNVRGCGPQKQQQQRYKIIKSQAKPSKAKQTKRRKAKERRDISSSLLSRVLLFTCLAVTSFCCRRARTRQGGHLGSVARSAVPTPCVCCWFSPPLSLCPQSQLSAPRPRVSSSDTHIMHTHPKTTPSPPPLFTGPSSSPRPAPAPPRPRPDARS